jgi:hypothetical protein
VGSAVNRLAPLAIYSSSLPLAEDLAARVCAPVVDALLVEAGCRLAQGQIEHEGYRSLEKRLQAMQEALLSDIVGNPFRPPCVEPVWLTRDAALVPQLAGQIHAERRWSDMPVLGDALEDAGCTNDEILDHCHGPGPHTRGCWVLDLLLGR